MYVHPVSNMVHVLRLFYLPMLAVTLAYEAIDDFIWGLTSEILGRD